MNDNQNTNNRNIDDSDQTIGDEQGSPPTTQQLTARLTYLFILLKRGDAWLRQGSRSAPGVLQGQGRVLRLLALHSPVAQKDLAYLLGIRSQSLAELLGKLEASGLVSRSQNPDDRRSWLVEITEEGRQQAESQPSIEEGPFSALEESERRQLAELLDRVIDEVEKNLPGGVDRRLQAMRRMWSGDEDPEDGLGWGPWGRGPRHRGGAEWFGGPQGHRRPESGRDPENHHGHRGEHGPEGHHGHDGHRARGMR
ncbi:MarR family winged helix-turn-helix transcriptional regulator [Propionibacterium sp.]|uniref:MarR family winged helix-turn-helix transcriptional regulator n=1 Tax=Propionibacterium sp. TaxID=1977903 RepID=UPI0039ED8669